MIPFFFEITALRNFVLFKISEVPIFFFMNAASNFRISPLLYLLGNWAKCLNKISVSEDRSWLLFLIGFLS